MVNNNYRLPITDYQLPITHYQLPITHYQLPITNYPLPIKLLQKPRLINHPLDKFLVGHIALVCFLDDA
ncbi:hypothetical protein BGP_1640 [Beggiatoa sp. PS]|nr:hypothetical protein BGP_1640 [Beggiatoa sp. PS]